MDQLTMYYCKAGPTDKELASACQIAESEKKPVCIMYQIQTAHTKYLIVNPGDEVYDLKEKLKNGYRCII